MRVLSLSRSLAALTLAASYHPDPPLPDSARLRPSAKKTAAMPPKRAQVKAARKQARKSRKKG